MRFGVGLPPGSAMLEQGLSVWFDRLLRLACRADEIGYEHVQVAEIPLSDDDDEYRPDPVPFLSAVSALTVGIRVMVAVVVPDEVRAPQLAGRLAMLDNLSHGRLDVSFVPAPRPAWPGLRERSPQASRARFGAGLDTCRRLWGGQDLDSMRLGIEPGSLRSYQSPCPPIFVVPPVSASSCSEAGRAGYHLHVGPAAAARPDLPEMLGAYRAGRRAAGLKPGRIRLEYACYLAEDDRFALTVAGRRVATATEAAASRPDFGAPAWLTDGAHRLDADRAYGENGILAGSPARVRDQIAGIADRLGEDVSLQMNCAEMSGADPEQALALFAEQVMPHFAGDPAESCSGA